VKQSELLNFRQESKNIMESEDLKIKQKIEDLEIELEFLR